MAQPTRERISRLRRTQTAQEIADSLGISVETVIAVQKGTLSALPASPGGVNRAYAERVEELNIPANYQGDPYAFGMQIDFNPSPGALVACVYAYEMVAPGTRAWRFWTDIAGRGSLDTAGFQTNNAASLQPVDLREQSVSASSSAFWVPRADPQNIKVGFRHNAVPNAQTVEATLRNQRLWVWEIAPEL